MGTKTPLLIKICKILYKACLNRNRGLCTVRRYCYAIQAPLYRFNRYLPINILPANLNVLIRQLNALIRLLFVQSVPYMCGLWRINSIVPYKANKGATSYENCTYTGMV